MLENVKLSGRKLVISKAHDSVLYNIIVILRLQLSFGGISTLSFGCFFEQHQQISEITAFLVFMTELMFVPLFCY